MGRVGPWIWASALTVDCSIFCFNQTAQVAFSVSRFESSRRIGTDTRMRDSWPEGKCHHLKMSELRSIV